MDIISISNAIQTKIKTLELGREILSERATDKANAIADYEKAIAKTLIGLKNGRQYVLEGEDIINPPATIMEKIAKGICYEEKFNSELAEAKYKNAVIGMQAIEAELSGYQSVWKYLEHSTDE